MENNLTRFNHQKNTTQIGFEGGFKRRTTGVQGHYPNNGEANGKEHGTHAI